ncbi:MAG TPA: S8 family serine peptidase [Bacteroidota bacterium]|nr:S8 family serine peptidase [Bacteroidota bacterium]
MRRSLAVMLLCVLFLPSLALHAQDTGMAPVPAAEAALSALSSIDASRLGSGRLYLRVLEALTQASAARDAGEATTLALQTVPVAVYMDTEPRALELAALDRLGVRVYPDYWTPPSEHHPRGFVLADMPAIRLPELLALEWIRRLDYTGGECHPANNEAARVIGADRAWTSGYTGKGVRVAVLDSGLDVQPPQFDLPTPIAARDYSRFPAIDTDVRNRITAHGTHVSASVLGRGVLSAENTGAGGGAFRGMAPGADLIFMKIGNDSTASSQDVNVIAALHDAVTLYGARVINMSYGGWGAYHDGSEADEQKADWCVDNGAAVFFSAGNGQSALRHYSVQLDPGEESDFIAVHYSVPNGGFARPSFNLVYNDGLVERHFATLRYFDANKQEITRVNYAPFTESPRGTESQYSSMKDTLVAGEHTIYLKMDNPTASRQRMHLYEDEGVGSPRFEAADPNYTIGSPACADKVMAVAAFTTRSYFVDHSGAQWQYRQEQGKLATFSSLGPRVDEARKPDIAAPGTAIISLRDRDMGTQPAWDWVDNDGRPGGEAMYQAMQGTSMASPICAGAAALILEKYPQLTPLQLYDTLQAHAREDALTGSVPNNSWGFGKLDVGFLSILPAAAPVWTKAAASLPAQGEAAELLVHASGVPFVLLHQAGGTEALLFRGNAAGTQWTEVLRKSALAGLTTLPNGSIAVFEPQAGRRFSTASQGGSWTEAAAPVGTRSVRRAWNDSLLLLATEGNGAFISGDNGQNWQSATGDLPAASTLVALEYGDHGMVYALANVEGKIRVFRALRGTWTWERKDAGISSEEDVEDLRRLPDATLLLVSSKRVYRSEDNGEWWQQQGIVNGSNKQLQVIDANVVLLSNAENGLYRSLDGGRSWENFHSGIDEVAVKVIAHGGAKGWAARQGHLWWCALPGLPGKPQLTAPANAGSGSGITPTLSWSPASNASAYHIQVGRGADLREVLYELRNHPEAWIKIAGLSNPDELHWRVRGVNAGGVGPWSDTWSFHTGAAYPAIPRPLAPADASVATSPSPTLLWEKAARAARYDVQVSEDPTFVTTVVERNAVTDTTLQLTGLRAGVPHYWRVRAANAQGASAWCRPQRFAAAPVPGAAGYALLFDHRGDRVAVPHCAAFDEIEAKDELTVEAWVNVDHYDNGYFPILDKYKPDIDWGWQFSVTSWGMDLNFIWAGANCDVPLPGAGWHHVAVAYKRSEGLARFFIDGSMVQAVACSADVPDVENDQPLLIGHGPSGGDEQAFGTIDEVRLWSVARDSAQIRSTMRSRLLGTEPGLALRMAFDEGSGATTVDGSGNAAVAPLVQHPEWVLSGVAWGAPEPPIPVLPVHNATDQPAQPRLLWSTVSGAERYRVELSTSAGFTPLLETVTVDVVNSAYPRTELPASAQIHWRIRAENTSGAGAWSTTGRFTTKAREPEPPILQSPAHQSSPPAPVELRWKSVAGAMRYRVQVSTNGSFTEVVLDSSGIQSTSLVAALLAANFPYYWHVSASNGIGSSPWSETWSYTPRVVPPAAPMLIDPANAALNVPLPVPLRWHAVDGASRYDVQVSLSPQCLAPYALERSDVRDTTLLATALQSGTTYYWRARASNLGGSGAWSTIWSFSTASAVLSTPVPIEPVAERTAVPTRPLLRWTGVDGANGYDLRLASDASFGNLLVDLTALLDTVHTLVDTIAAGQWVYWQVRARQAVNTSAWSVAQRFRVLRPIPLVTALLEPVHGAVNLDTAQVSFRWQGLLHVDDYTLQCAESTDFTAVLENVTVADSTAVLGPFASGRRLYWRVRGNNERGEGPWSEVWDFTLRNTTALLPVPSDRSLRILALYPQPASEVLRLIVESDATSPRLELNDLLGRVRLTRTLSLRPYERENISVALPNLPNGWYMLRLTGGGASEQRLLMLKR